MGSQEKTELQKWVIMNRKNLPYVLIAPVLAVLVLAFAFFQNKAAENVFNLEVYLSTFELFWIPLFTVNMVYLAGKIAERTSFIVREKIILKFVFCVAGAIAATGMMELFYAANGIVDDDIISLGEVTLSPVATNFVTNALIAMAISLPIFFSQERKKRLELSLAARQMEVEKLEKLQTQSRLEALQSKVNPHFLYNSLNTLAALVYTDPAKAEKVILGLSELFRYNLQKDERQLVSLGEEVEIVKTYLEIESIRFEGSLEYKLEIDDALLQCKVPRFLLQPLVENAVKHGTSQIAKGKILLKISGDPQALNICVEDNGKPFPDEIEMGFGISSTAEKLSLLFPQNHELHWTNSPSKSFNILIKENA